MNKTTAQKALDLLNEMAHAIHEINHARTNPNWFTNGKSAAIQHGNLWTGRAAEIAKNSNDARAALEAELAQPVEPVDCQFQDRDGKWHGFMNEKHKANTIADGTWPIRYLFAAPQEAAAPAPVNAEMLEALKYARRMVNASECDISYIDAAIKKAEGAA